MTARLRPILCTLLLSASVFTSCRANTPCTPGVDIGDGMICPSKHTLHKSPYKLPFKKGYITRINQSYHDYPTHHGDESFAIDFSCKPGDPILAARQGVVWEVRKESFEGCMEQSCMGKDNFVLIDHGDGTRAGYHHLAPMGVTIKEGEQVCQGQLIGICGNTGYSSGPHLHWQLNALWEHSIPATFREFEEQTDHPYGIVHTSYTSDNTRQSRCDHTTYSSLDRDAFSHRGITLDAPLSTYLTDDKPVTITGTYHGQQPHVALHIKGRQAANWTAFCASTDKDGRFSITLDWDEVKTHTAFYWLMLTGAGQDCTNTRWSWSYEVQVEPHKKSLPQGQDYRINPNALDRDEPRPIN